MTKRIACVFAHPDDDTYGVGGSLALHAGSDIEIIWQAGTLVESSSPAGPTWTPVANAKAPYVKITPSPTGAKFYKVQL